MFRGVFTALITPFKNGQIDEEAFCNLVEWQIQEGIHGLVVAATTGELTTLTSKEYETCIRLAITTAKGRVPIIAGSGTNATASTIEKTKIAKELGVDAALVVTPYYNKPTQEGMRRHFEALSEAVDLPIILYNVPGRTVVDMNVDTVASLAKLKNIVGIKDATDDLSRPLLTRRACGESFSMLTGENATFGAFLAHGGDGGILVTSNVTPRALREMYDAWIARDIEKFHSINLALILLHRALFSETSPSPTKYALSRLGKCRNELRLPLCEASPTAQRLVDEALKVAAESGHVAGLTL